MAELPPEIATLIEQKRAADEPSAEDQARVSRSLAAALGLPTSGWGATELETPAAVSGGSSSAGVAGMSLTVKAALVAAVVMTGAGAAFVWRGNSADSNPRSQSAPARSVSPIETPARVALEPAARSQPGSVDTAPESLARSALPMRDSAPAQAVPRPSAEPKRSNSSAEPVSAGSRVRRSPEVSSRQSRRLQPIAADPAPLPTADPAVARVRRQAAGDPAIAARSDRLEGELSLITAASQSLDNGDTAAAVEALEAHRVRFAAGFLSEEREALWIVALCDEGRAAEAATARAAFERRAPRSPLRVRIETRCKTQAVTR